MNLILPAASLTLVVLLSSPRSSVVTAQVMDFPYTYTNCDVSSTIDSPPQRAVTLNQGTTEIMLALGLADSMAGTAYLDDEVSEQQS
jgi:iron complex transport system substrate-binding protein